MSIIAVRWTLVYATSSPPKLLLILSSFPSQPSRLSRSHLEMLPASKLYFTSILEALYHKCDGVIFEPASMRDYLETLNLSVAGHDLRIKENKIGHACALVYALYNASSEDKRYLAGWEPQIITQLGIDPATYKQRKSDIKNGQASGSVMNFYDSIVEMLA